MPITTKHGSMLDDSKAQVLVCPVNCVGVMGKGLALEFKKRWPHMHSWYKEMCRNQYIEPGSIYHDPTHSWDKVCLAFTKDHWRSASRIEWVDSCLLSIAGVSSGPFGISSIAIPQLGCGCGGLDWADVWPLYEKHLGGLDCDVEVWIYE